MKKVQDRKISANRATFLYPGEYVLTVPSDEKLSDSLSGWCDSQGRECEASILTYASVSGVLVSCLLAYLTFGEIPSL